MFPTFGAFFSVECLKKSRSKRQTQNYPQWNFNNENYNNRTLILKKNNL